MTDGGAPQPDAGGPETQPTEAAPPSWTIWGYTLDQADRRLAVLLAALLLAPPVVWLGWRTLGIAFLALAALALVWGWPGQDAAKKRACAAWAAARRLFRAHWRRLLASAVIVAAAVAAMWTLGGWPDLTVDDVFERLGVWGDWFGGIATIVVVWFAYRVYNLQSDEMNKMSSFMEKQTIILGEQSKSAAISYFIPAINELKKHENMVIFNSNEQEFILGTFKYVRDFVLAEARALENYENLNGHITHSFYSNADYQAKSDGFECHVVLDFKVNHVMVSQSEYLEELEQDLRIFYKNISTNYNLLGSSWNPHYPSCSPVSNVTYTLKSFLKAARSCVQDPSAYQKDLALRFFKHVGIMRPTIDRRMPWSKETIPAWRSLISSTGYDVALQIADLARAASLYSLAPESAIHIYNVCDSLLDAIDPVTSSVDSTVRHPPTPNTPQPGGVAGGTA